MKNKNKNIDPAAWWAISDGDGTFAVDGIHVHAEVLEQVAADLQAPSAGGDVQRAEAFHHPFVLPPEGLHRLPEAAPAPVQHRHQNCNPHPKEG